MGRSSSGISDAERKKLQALAEQMNEEAILLLAKKNREAVSSNKFVHLSVETDTVYNSRPVIQIDLHCIIYTSTVAKLQSPETWRRANQERVSQGFASMPVNSNVKNECVVCQFLVDNKADHLQILEPGTLAFGALDAVVDEILPRVKYEKVHVGLGLFYSGSRSETKTGDVEKEITVNSERQTMDLSELPIGRAQNCNVAMGFLSLEAMQHYVSTSVKLGLESTPTCAVTQANLVQFGRCSITKLTVEHVLAMMPPAMSMHMLGSEIQQAMDKGKMYVVTAGMLRQSEAGEGSKIIFSMRMLRALEVEGGNAGFEVPTYDSHTVEVPGSSQTQHRMHMAENIVNFLVHFKKNTPADHNTSIELTGRDRVHHHQTKLVGHYEKVESEQWPAVLIQEIVNGAQPCLQGSVLSPYNVAGITSVVMTPEKHYTASSNLDYILWFSGIHQGCSGALQSPPEGGEMGDFAMWVKVMSRDINNKGLCNDNISAMTVSKKANTPIRTTCGDDLEVFATSDAICKGTLYPNQAALSSYGLDARVQEPGWKIAAAGIMFSGQYAVYVTTSAVAGTHAASGIDQHDEESMHEYYAHTRVPLQNACITSDYADDQNEEFECLTNVVNEDTAVTIHVCLLKSSLSFHNTNTQFQSIYFAEGDPSEPADLGDVFELQKETKKVDRENSTGSIKSILLRPQAHFNQYCLDKGENMYSIVLALPEEENKKMHRVVCLKFVNASSYTPIREESPVDTPPGRLQSSILSLERSLCVGRQ